MGTSSLHTNSDNREYEVESCNPESNDRSRPGEGMGLDFSARLRFPGLDFNVAFTVNAAECLALVGPSGAGKTTCLSIAAGLLRPDRAAVRLDGKVLIDTAAGIDLPPERRHLGLLSQDYLLFPHLSVLENAAYGARRRLRNRRKAHLVAMDWLQRLGMRERAGEPVAGLSGGERQRVALARAVASGARALLFDEPLAALDVTTRASVRSTLREFLKEVRLPSIVVTHDVVDAFVLGDRIAVIESGKIVQIGLQDDLLRHPRSAFVADLAGLNFIQVEVAEGEGLKEARADGVIFHVLSDDLSGPAYLSFPPSEVTLFLERPAGSAQNVLPGRIVEMTPLPHIRRTVVDVGILITADITEGAMDAMGLHPGTTVWAAVKTTAIRVYR